MQRNDFPTITLGVDHGYKNMKTANSIFPTKLGQLQTVPDDKSGILQLDNKIYTENGEYVSFVNNSDKVSNNNFYILTVFAIAKELKMKNLDGAVINLAAGLPQKWFDSQKDTFKDYLMKHSELHFKYEEKTYHVYFNDCKVFTQGYAAFVTLNRIDEYLNKNVVICDIGGGTVDIITVNKGKIDYANSKIDQKATIWLINSIIETAEAKLYEVIPEDYIIEYMLNGSAKADPTNKYETLMQQELINYCEMIFNRLKEFRINVNITPVIFVGGGATVIQNFGSYNPSMTEFITEINANAKGYELIYNLIIKE